MNPKPEKQSITISDHAHRSIWLMQTQSGTIYASFQIIEEFITSFDLPEEMKAGAFDAMQQLVIIKGYMQDIINK